VDVDLGGHPRTPGEPRDQLALALDVDDLAAAVALADRLRPWFGVVKVGLELFAGAGPAAVEKLAAPDRRIFLDLKLHDIPTTVGKAARQVGRLGVSYLTVHTAGGVDMLRAGVEGLEAGASDAGAPLPMALGVTVLTSDPDASAFPTRLDAAVAGGCGGVVCSVRELPMVKQRCGGHPRTPGFHPYRPWFPASASPAARPTIRPGSALRPKPSPPEPTFSSSAER
jgi:orotidine 5'-phosphate decarboxylase subfamily 1